MERQGTKAAPLPCPEAGSEKWLLLASKNGWKLQTSPNPALQPLKPLRARRKGPGATFCLRTTANLILRRRCTCIRMTTQFGRRRRILPAACPVTLLDRRKYPTAHLAPAQLPLRQRQLHYRRPARQFRIDDKTAFRMEFRNRIVCIAFCWSYSCGLPKFVPVDSVAAQVPLVTCA